ncbi:hypothetical protein BB560_003123 [Smittium megazygosporum]|uniref:ethanolamine kinase n=1 Tax=Smittium megazygosporum TaxID=133381 RepID=A0A2T9ZCX8_9FUNG|nr:hypothetical protein BB560_003123 [Smittium megazygosporum]
MESAISSLPSFDFTVHERTLLGDAASLALKLFPEWKSEDIELTQLTEGITNLLVLCRNKKLDIGVLIREYGKKSEYIIDRQRELFNTMELAKYGLAQKIYCKFNNGIVYGYTEGSTVSPKVMCEEPMISFIPKALSMWHKAPIAGDKVPSLFIILRNWVANIPDTYEDPAKAEAFKANFSKEQILNEIDFMESEVNKIMPPVAFCHNDLLSGNILLNKNKDGVFLIDYEYGSYNYRGYDIANHFCEFAGFECDYSRYPDTEKQRKWLRKYLSYLHEVEESKVDEKEIEDLLYEVSIFENASSLYWGIWSLIQANYSEIDFDYMSYAKLRFSRYYYTKKLTNFRK